MWHADTSRAAFPQDNPQVYELYWSPTQVRARAHPSVLSAQRHLMTRFWRASPSAEISFSQPVTYADRLRIRTPGDAAFALGPHMDGGSVERWEKEGYGDVYAAVMAGNWDDGYDPWDAGSRARVSFDTHGGLGACSAFRMWQGWLSVSRCGPGEGTLLVNPLLRASTAYVLLRPFFRPVRERAEFGDADKGEEGEWEGYLHEDNWVFAGGEEMTSEIQGAVIGHGQELTDEMHPHLELGRTMVHVPEIKAGDYVAWHCDSTYCFCSPFSFSFVYCHALLCGSLVAFIFFTRTKYT